MLLAMTPLPTPLITPPVTRIYFILSPVCLSVHPKSKIQHTQKFIIYILSVTDENLITKFEVLRKTQKCAGGLKNQHLSKHILWHEEFSW